ncbi:2-hydroxy-6-oxonona-2,4-dienedioate hydrolase [Pseudonocardia ammonioxydans]|uniref:2-hydroxy-6-oxonona-2,4-dienedioate hydrolase n=1 Tax=Pseudonocardia ammonioxydans TaxID=260086 RepID=A0A1I5IZH1_PSUAM|nr:alpha/beta fold hydrolase [Pseudonocardia ammonioxydans]SFO65994.1 2-hydroxy-6-oxonona-2,4-dienedioate hydrolase [Pseudonocardia ammonioxydans]
MQAARNQSHRSAAARCTAPWCDQAAQFARVRTKTLGIWGREDRVNPLEIGLQLLRDIPDCRLLVFRECGHWAQIEHATEFNRTALEFLAAAA